MTKFYNLAGTATLIFLTSGVAISPTAPANAQVATDQMSCAQAVATYEKNRRIYVRQRSGQVLPVYSGVPVSERRNLWCGRKAPYLGEYGYRVETADNKRCIVMYQCH